MRPLRPDTLGGRHHVVERTVGDETRKPNLRGFKVYVGTFVAIGDGGNDPPETSASSPDWQNGFGYAVGSPLWFAHGLDGETDMGGAYDLITGSPVNGTVAFTMPLEWANSLEEFAMFPALIEEGATPDLDIFIVCLQRVDYSTGDIRVYWPIYAQAYTP
jgi:hypothetical protein